MYLFGHPPADAESLGQALGRLHQNNHMAQTQKGQAEFILKQSSVAYGQKQYVMRRKGSKHENTREAAPSYDRLDVNTVKSMPTFGLARTSLS